MHWNFKKKPSYVAWVGPKLQGSRIILTPFLTASGTTIATSKSYGRVKKILSLIYKVNILVR